MAFNLNYDMETQASVTSDWTFSGPASAGLSDGSGSNGQWSRINGASGSTGVGPDAGNPGFYVFTEMTAQSNGAVWTATHNNTFDAATQDITFNFDYGARGNSVQALIDIQTNEAGAGWVTRFTTGFGDDVIPATGSAVGIYFSKVANLAGLISSANTQIRIQVTANTGPDTSQFWHNDIAFDNINIVGVDNVIGDPPVINIPGPNPINIEQGDTYTPPVVTASDTEDGNLTGSIVVGGDTVDSSTAGTYTVTYTVTDSDGNEAMESLVVNVNGLLITLNQAIPNTVGTFAPSLPIIDWTGGGLIGLEASSPAECLRQSGPTAAYQNELSDLTYVLDANSLHVVGDCYLTPYMEKIVTSDTGSEGLVIENGGTLNVVGYSEFNGNRSYTQRTWFRHQNLASFNDPGFLVQNGGTLNWVGGEAIVPNGIQFDATSVVNIENAVLDNYEIRMDGVNSTLEQQVRQSSANLSVNGLVFYRGFFTFLAAALRFSRYQPIQCGQAIAFSSGTPDINVPFLGYRTDGSNLKDVALWQGARPIFINPDLGPSFNIGPNATGGNGVRGLVRVLHIISHTILDPVRNLIADTYIAKLSDTNSGNRGPDFNNEGFSGDPYVSNQDFGYAAQSSVSGVGETIVASLIVSVPTSQAASAGNINIGAYTPDYRFDNQTGFTIFQTVPVMAFRYWKDGFVATELSTSLLTNEGANIKAEPTLFPDFNRSVVPLATLQAQTEINDQQTLYDHQSVWMDARAQELLNNVDRITDDDSGYNIEPVFTGVAITARAVLGTLGGLGNFPIDNVGNAAAIPVSLNPSTNANPFQYDGTEATVYISTGGFEGVLTTTGGVTLLGGTDLSNLTINGDLSISVAGTYNFSNVTVTGNVVNSDGTGNVLINATNGSTLTPSNPGTGNGQVNIVNVIAWTFLVVDSNQNPVENAEVTVTDGLDPPNELFNLENTPANGVVNYVFDGSLSGTNATILVLKSGLGALEPFSLDTIHPSSNTTNNLQLRLDRTENNP